MAAKKKVAKLPTAVVDPPASTIVQDAAALDAAGRYVGQWNRLVSTTNWEKGRIICQWRDALVAGGGPASAYSDEAWTQLVGGVTSQHVGRLRRVFQRFGDAFDQYEGLYWSHFQASIDWDDAEMWLEGAIHNRWSVSQMRGKRWETLGKSGDAPLVDDAAEADESTVDLAEDAPMGDAVSAGTTDEELAGAEGAVDGKAKRSPRSRDDADDEPPARESDRSSRLDATPPRSRLAVEVDDLPEDLADAFEQFKLAIIAQRRLGWSETTPEAVIECLDALRELAHAPADD